MHDTVHTVPKSKHGFDKIPVAAAKPKILIMADMIKHVSVPFQLIYGEYLHERKKWSMGMENCPAASKSSAVSSARRKTL